MDRFCWLFPILLAAMYAPDAAAELETPEPRRFVLEHSQQLESVVGRRMLAHLIACALEPDVVASAEVAGESFGFPGVLGLAPAWLERTPSESDERWVSACVLAQINYFGQRVPFSLRGPGAGLKSLQPDEEERKAFTVHEGGFFGNLFAAEPAAYVCAGGRSDGEESVPGLQKRVCTERSDDPELAKQGLSRCGFHLVGACDRRTTFEVAGKSYREVIHVYLRAAEGD